MSTIIIEHYKCEFGLYQINGLPVSLPVLGLSTLGLQNGTCVTVEIHYQAGLCIALVIVVDTHAQAIRPKNAEISGG